MGETILHVTFCNEIKSNPIRQFLSIFSNDRSLKNAMLTIPYASILPIIKLGETFKLACNGLIFFFQADCKYLQFIQPLSFTFDLREILKCFFYHIQRVTPRSCFNVLILNPTCSYLEDTAGLPFCVLIVKLRSLTWAIKVIYQKRLRGFHQGFQTPRNGWKHDRMLLLFQGVWSPWWETKHEFLSWLLKLVWKLSTIITEE